MVNESMFKKIKPLHQISAIIKTRRLLFGLYIIYNFVFTAECNGTMYFFFLIFTRTLPFQTIVRNVRMVFLIYQLCNLGSVLMSRNFNLLHISNVNNSQCTELLEDFIKNV